LRALREAIESPMRTDLVRADLTGQASFGILMLGGSRRIAATSSVVGAAVR
jgi:hypothetical protein